MGAIGMAGTLKDLHRDGMYSVTNVAMDMTRFLILAGELGRERGGTGEARVLFGIDPGRLRVAFDPSDRIARERLGAHLRGVQSVARPALERPCGGTSVSATVSLEALPKLAVALTAQSLVAVLRKLHQARISTDEFEGSILPVVDAARRARTM
jgi:hypothetical protein